jgi:hypothetical protein
MAKLETRVSADIAQVSVDVKSIKSNHLPHIEAAIKALAKGTPNEDHVKAILDLTASSTPENSDSPPPLAVQPLRPAHQPLVEPQ